MYVYIWTYMQRQVIEKRGNARLNSMADVLLTLLLIVLYVGFYIYQNYLLTV